VNVGGLQPGHRVGIEVVGGRRYFGEVVSVDDAGTVTLQAIGSSRWGHLVRTISKDDNGRDVFGPERPCTVCGGPEETT